MDRTTFAVSFSLTLAGALTLQWAIDQVPASTAHVVMCGSGPAAEVVDQRAEQDAAAQALVDLANEWNDEAFAELRGPHERGGESFPQQAAFIHDALGECGVPVFHENHRYYANCERGRMEVAPHLDDHGYLKRAYWGAQDVEPGPGVRAGAVGVLLKARDWDSDLGTQVFSPRKGAGKMQARIAKEYRRFGACEIDSVDIAGARGAIFVLECEKGQRRMKVSLDDEKRVRKVRFMPVREHRPGAGR